MTDITALPVLDSCYRSGLVRRLGREVVPLAMATVVLDLVHQYTPTAASARIRLITTRNLIVFLCMKCLLNLHVRVQPCPIGGNSRYNDKGSIGLHNPVMSEDRKDIVEGNSRTSMKYPSELRADQCPVRRNLGRCQRRALHRRSAKGAMMLIMPNKTQICVQ